MQSQGLNAETVPLTRIFGFPDAQGIEHIAENFDFSQVRILTRSNHGVRRVRLTPVKFSCSELGRVGNLKTLVARLSLLYGKLRISDLKDEVKIGICITLRLLGPWKETTNAMQAGDELTWKYLSEQLCQAAHLR